MEKVIRTICLFTQKLTPQTKEKFIDIENLLSKNNFIVQTKRICFSKYDTQIDTSSLQNDGFLIGRGKVSFEQCKKIMPHFLKNNISINLDLTNEEISIEHVKLLFEIIKDQPAKTFNFTYGFNTPPSSPYFPSANFKREGFSIGLQPTNLSAECTNIEQWFCNMQNTWQEICDLFCNYQDFLGIDSSIAPLFSGNGSLLQTLNNFGYNFNDSITTDVYTKISSFIKEKNPKPIGLCGIMFPCLEDFKLADEYEKENFNIERNIFLSLHSGLGIDSYPIGIDQDPKKIIDILKLIQALSNKYQKPLSTRFISDGKTKIGQRTNLNNQYLKDVIVKEL